MISREIWLDKLPEDKASYFNKSKMSIDLFAKHMELSAYNIEMLMHENGYVYMENERKFIAQREYNNRVSEMLNGRSYNV